MVALSQGRRWGSPEDNGEEPGSAVGSLEGVGGRGWGRQGMGKHSQETSESRFRKKCHHHRTWPHSPFSPHLEQWGSKESVRFQGRDCHSSWWKRVYAHRATGCLCWKRPSPFTDKDAPLWRCPIQGWVPHTQRPIITITWTEAFIYVILPMCQEWY